MRVIISRKTKYAGNVTRMGGRRNAHSVSFGKPESKRTFGWPGRERGDDIKLYLKD